MQVKRFAIGAVTAIFLALAVHAGASAEKHPPSKPIDLNAANAKELQQLPGVGPVTAQRILDLRQKSGHFHRVEDLLAVRGISQKKLDALRPYVTISAPTVPVPTSKNAPATQGKKG